MSRWLADLAWAFILAGLVVSVCVMLGANPIDFLYQGF